MAEFIAEFTLRDSQGTEETLQWNIYMDGSSNRQVGKVGVVLISLEEDRVECMIRLEFHTTNNEAEYEALIAGLDLARAAEAKNMVIHCDSQVITSQVNGSYECKSERMKKYLDEVKGWIGYLQIKFVQILREENEYADWLAKATLAERMLVPNQVLSFVQTSSLIDNVMNVQEVEPGSNWTTPLISYLKAGVLLNGKDTARKLKVQASRFILMKDILYKRG